MKRSRLKAVVNHDVKNKKHGSLLIVNTNNIKNLKNKFGPINIDYNNLFTLIYMAII